MNNNADIVGKMIKRNKKGKIRKVVTVFQNDLGWLKIRTDQGVETWLDIEEALNGKVERWLAQGYEWEIPLRLKSKVVGRFQTTYTT